VREGEAVEVLPEISADGWALRTSQSPLSFQNTRPRGKCDGCGSVTQGGRFHHEEPAERRRAIYERLYGEPLPADCPL